MPTKALDDDRLMSLVELALTQPPEAREEYISAVCADDAELTAEVRKYVQWEVRMGDFLLNPLFPPLDLEHPFEAGELLAGRFRIVRELGEGGMGVVYEAQDEKLDRRIAIKCAKTGFCKRLPPEVRNARDITHPNVCKIFEIHTAPTPRGEIDFLAMELLEGETLAGRLRRGRLPTAQAREIARQLCAGLAEAHRAGVTHGDVKTNNIILCKDSAGAQRAVITDFGLARRPGRGATRATAQSLEAGGAMDYMAPELWKGKKASPASDVYALGVVLCELTTGRRPFPADTPLEKRLTRKPPKTAAGKWGRVPSRCLNPEPKRRFQDAGRVAAALEPSVWPWYAAAAVLIGAVALTAYRYLTAPKEVVRLAMPTMEASSVQLAPTALKLSEETAKQLARIDGGKVARFSVSHAFKNPTHTLHATFALQDSMLLLHAQLIEERSRLNVKDWFAVYGSGEERYVPVALAGMVTAALNLPPLAIPPVNAAASQDYKSGMSYLRWDSGLEVALQHFEKAVKEDPDSPLTFAGIAQARWLKFWDTNDPMWLEAAKEAERQAESRDPDSAAVHRIEGLLLNHEGMYRLAESEYSRAVQLEPGNSDGHRWLALTYRTDHQRDRAETEYREAIARDPDYYRAHQDLGAFYAAGSQHSEAVKHLERAVQLAPNESGPHYALGLVYTYLGRYAEAETQLSMSIARRPTRAAMYDLAINQLYLGENRDAAGSITRALNMPSPRGTPEYDLLMYRGIAYDSLALRDAARRDYMKGRGEAVEDFARRPNNGKIQATIAYFDAALGDDARAKSEAGAALALSPDDDSTLWPAVLAFEKLRLRSETLKALSNAPHEELDDFSRWPGLKDLQTDPHFKDLLAARRAH
jgi:serine/threonine protein kinase